MIFEDWFKAATGSPPFPYQAALATGASLPHQLSVPTGLGKTAAVALGWLWRRRFAGDPALRAATPRRLVYCLPVRSLVEQTEQALRGWLRNLGVEDVAVHALMGGRVSDPWDETPAADAVLIGTQDQLLSRALNRGYGMSRFRWPVHFAWLHNDALWIFDEVQLMGVGASTGAQLQGLRDKLGTARPTHTMWVTATPAPARLATIDAVWPLRALGLGAGDLAHPVALDRLGARKRLLRIAAAERLDPARWPALIAEAVVQHRAAGERCLVVLNQVARAQAVFEQLRKRGVEARLLHSRFRAGDRARSQAAALDPAYRGVIVTTQAIEAGVDLSAATLLTEACPWSSFVQRVGRCNRYGEHPQATVVWLGLPADDKVCAPYTAEELALAEVKLEGLEDVGPSSLAHVPMPDGEPALPVLRRRDLLGLFDTEADLSGLDLDVSAYVRDTEDADVSVAWRAFDPERGPSPDDPAPHQDELCRVRLSRLRELLKRATAWRWSSLEGEWLAADSFRIAPGQTLLLSCAAGGYDAALGFTGEAAHTPAPVDRPGRAMDHDEADGADPLSHLGAYVSLRVHSEDTAAAMVRLSAALSDSATTPWAELCRAARWHDLGKAHPVFQEMLTAGLPEADARRAEGPWAKSDGVSGGRSRRPHFRHELASAIAFLAQGATDLEAYVVAAHHGKARLTIRSRPTERPVARRGKPLLGLLDGDTLPTVDLGGGEVSAATTLSLDRFALGGGAAARSWMSLGQGLLAAQGPFRLAWAEALLRVADWEASRLRMTGALGPTGSDLDRVGGAN
jgi:CRISPR-associated endonuclease/helicase Cas3